MGRVLDQLDGRIRAENDPWVIPVDIKNTTVIKNLEIRNSDFSSKIRIFLKKIRIFQKPVLILENIF